MKKPIKQEIIRNPDGTFPKGVTGNPNGRPKGKTIKERVLEYLENNPEAMGDFVAHFVEKNRELTWQMLEGRPSQQTDITTAGKPIPLLHVRDNESDNEDTETE